MNFDPSSILAISRWRIRSNAESDFLNAWTTLTAIARDRVTSAGGNLLMRYSDRPLEYVAIARWQSLEDWQRFWKNPPVDSQTLLTLYGTSHLLSHEVMQARADCPLPQDF